MCLLIADVGLRMAVVWNSCTAVDGLDGHKGSFAPGDIQQATHLRLLLPGRLRAPHFHDQENLLSFVTHLHALRVLELPDHCCCRLRHLARLPMLTSLQVGMCVFGDKEVAMPQLQRLVCNNIDVGSLSSVSNLISLRMPYAEHSYVSEVIQGGAPHLPGLRDMYICSLGNCLDWMLHLSNWTSLTRLHIHWAGVSKEALHQIGQLQYLEELHISPTIHILHPTAGASFQQTFSWLRSLYGLTRLRLLTVHVAANALSKLKARQIFVNFYSDWEMSGASPNLVIHISCHCTDFYQSCVLEVGLHQISLEQSAAH